MLDIDLQSWIYFFVGHPVAFYLIWKVAAYSSGKKCKKMKDFCYLPSLATR